MKPGREYEILIEELYKKLDPESVIKRNDKIYGHDSKIFREIDVSITHQVGPHKVLMIIQAKDHKEPVDVNVIGEFIAVIKDVRANKGILISAKGFAEAALTLAKANNIDAMTGHDLSNPKWTIDLQMPVVLNVYTGSYLVDFKLEASQEYADMANSGKTPQAPPWHLWRISDDGGKKFFTINEKFQFLCVYDHLKWYDDMEHTAEFDGDELLLFVMDGVLTPLRDFKFKYRVNRKAYYKYFEVKEFQGFINRENNVISRANVKVEGEEFTVLNYEIIAKKELDLTTWDVYNDTVELIHPYRVQCALVNVGIPKEPMKFTFAGTAADKNGGSNRQPKRKRRKN